MTGAELNRSTGTLNYDALAGRYAIIAWGPSRYTTIQLDVCGYCGAEFTQSCMLTYGNAPGFDEAGNRWEICATAICY